MITEVKDVKGGMPNIFSLQQNYANPFGGIKDVRYFLSYDGQAGKQATRAEVRENNERDTVRKRPERKG